MKGTLHNLKKAIKGEVVMNAELDKTYQSLMNNLVPDMWKARSYPSLKPLQSWFDDLVKRTEFFRSWLNMDGKPKAYWLSAFFFPQGFLTSVLQNFARHNRIAIDVLNFAFKFTKSTEQEQITEVSPSGAFIYGLFIEGCQFDISKGYLEDSSPGIMYTQAPIIEFTPAENHQPKPEEYKMPVYKTTVRAGTLSTTGHSTNFIIGIDVPSKKKPEYWILKGAAFTCALND